MNSFVKDIHGRLFNLNLAELIYIEVGSDEKTYYVRARYKSVIGIDAVINLFKSTNANECQDYIDWLNRQVGVGNQI